MGKVKKVSLLLVWVLFFCVSIPFRIAQLVTNGRLAMPSPKSWFPGAIIGIFVANVPDLLSIAIYVRLRWILHKTNRIEPADNGSQMESEHGEYYHGIYVGPSSMRLEDPTQDKPFQSLPGQPEASEIGELILSWQFLYREL